VVRNIDVSGPVSVRAFPVQGYERMWSERFDALDVVLEDLNASTKEMVAMAGSATVTLPTDEQILITREFDAPKDLVYPHAVRDRRAHTADDPRAALVQGAPRRPRQLGDGSWPAGVVGRLGVRRALVRARVLMIEPFV
jgi:hypothetical protein